MQMELLQYNPFHRRKLITIKASSNSGSVYHNYKGFSSIIIHDVVDVDYKFICVDAGAIGSTSDYVVFNSSDFKAALENRTLGLSEDKELPYDTEPIPYLLIGDDAFPCVSTK